MGLTGVEIFKDIIEYQCVFKGFMQNTKQIDEVKEAKAEKYHFLFHFSYPNEQ